MRFFFNFTNMEDRIYQRDESFRNKITTVNEEGNRKWLYPKKPNGKFTNYRTYTSYVLLIILFAIPWIKIDGEPFLMFNIISRKFVLFGQVFWPQDFHIFGLIMISMVIFIVLFTSVYGRIFCGWICPQTIFMESVYRKIEYLIDGDYKEQQHLKIQKWDLEKIGKRSLKYTLFYIIAVAISHTFLAYIIGSDGLLEIQKSPLDAHLGGFIAMLAFSLVFFFVFAWFREQVCLIVCPYGRLQGVLLDRNTLVVAYDYIRGEGRSKYRKDENRKEAGKGDCIDCHQCVDVCPTGIDIRNGTQLECINCTACIDVCDHIMEITNQPKGLIRIDSENAIAENKKNKFSIRSKAYTIFLLLLIVFISFLFKLRGGVETTILRTPGVIYQETENGQISNLYNVKVVNKSSAQLDLSFKLIDSKGKIKMVGQKDLIVKRGESNQQAFFIEIDKKELNQENTPLKIGIFDKDKMIEEEQTTFNGPAN